MNYLPKYNHLVHRTPIKWFRTKVSAPIEMGPNEEKIKRINTAAYPEGCVLVDFSHSALLKINFMNKTRRYNDGTPKRDVLIFEKWGAYQYVDGLLTYVASEKFDTILTSQFSCDYQSIEERLIYAEYIVGKANNVVL